MNEAIGTKTTYFITQINLDTKVEQFIEYNNYSGSFNSTTSAEMATRFDSVDTAIELAKLQNKLSQLMNRQFSYRAIEEVVERKEIYAENDTGEPIEESVE